MRTCGNCGSGVDEDARFCSTCGAAQLTVCRSCGAELPVDARFCPSCGTPTDAAAAGERGPTRTAERKLVTVLFADVTGSTALGERLDPEPLRDVLDAYFSAMRETIEAEGGTVEKFIGDAVMAVFGVPLAHEDDPARALRASLRMLARLADVNVDLEATHGLSLQIRIGVNTGEVLASPDAEPGEPMVTGDVVNTAARLQSAAEPGTVLVADRTARAARGFAFGEPTSLSLRGKRAAVAARQLFGHRDGDDGDRSGIGAPMVGRDREVRLLSTLFERVADERHPHLVTIYGEPGVGKSRLTREFVGSIVSRRDEPLILTGRCLPYGSGVTYWPLAEIVKERAGIRDADGPDDVLAKLDALRAVSAEPVDATKLRSAFAATLGLDDPRRPTTSLEPKQVRREIHDAWRWLLGALAAERPIVVVIEDIHWADDAVLDLVDELADRLDAPVLFVCPARPELTQRRAWGGGRRQASSIELDPLDATAADRLVTLLLDIDELPKHVRRRILARAEGNPFFIEEIVRHLIDSGRIARVDGRWHASSDVGDVDIPDTVQGVLAARIDLLEPADKRVLQLGAVVGRVFWPGSVRAQLDGDGDDLDAALERLRSRDLVLARSASTVTGEREFIFKHVLTRDVAYETLPRRDRAGAHRTVATWIEGSARERVGEFTELLAHHYEQAYEAERADPHADGGALRELRRRAFEAILAAAEAARRRFAVRHAYELVERALAVADEPLERARALECRGHAALTDYRGDDAWTSFREAVDLRVEHAPEDRLAIAYAAARAVESPMRWPGSMREWPDDDVVTRYLQIGFEHAGTATDETRVRLLAARAFMPFGLVTTRSYAGDREAHDRAVADGLEAADLALEIG
ncbi:MAG TPA: adenylate/guanylate cyclase domain-containing protein, partial [Actinomycetota bacterium]|nr:adenylate/guanylate cyclase domain-containing protein [Actinomycetota bacterium]